MRKILCGAAAFLLATTGAAFAGHGKAGLWNMSTTMNMAMSLPPAVLAQMKACLEAAGSSLAQVLKCNVYCTPNPSHFAAFNAVYQRYFPDGSPARIFLHVPSWPGSFDLEIDCVATVE